MNLIQLLLGRQRLDVKLERRPDGAGERLVEPHPGARDGEAMRQGEHLAHGAPAAPRQERLGSIKTPLDLRTQTILSRQLSENEQAALRGFVQEGNQGRKG